MTERLRKRYFGNTFFKRYDIEYKKMKDKRKSRFSNYEGATERSNKKYVFPDGTPMSKNQIVVKKGFEELKKRTTR